METFGIDLSRESMIAIGIVVFLYVFVITAFGGYFARFNSNINDFFYSGNRFAWWLPAASMVATGIGSYSYLKYSEQGYNTGMSSSLTYMNDWFIIPFFIFGWLPIVYFARVKSIPEYFERRFNRTARYISMTIILAYMFFYIGYNLYTIGVALEGMFGVSQLYSIPLVAAFLGAYVTFGGQTAVIFTDLFQGIMLYVAGGIAILAGIAALGGFGEFWSWLPISHRLPFVHLTENPKFNTAGLFWGEALAGSIAFTFMNQGFLMRYLTIKSVNDGRKAAFFNVLVTLPLSAVIVGAVGWIGKALIAKQAYVGGPLAGINMIEITNTFHTFIIVCWETVKQNPWIFGFVIAALMAALMSTIDTLINACAAIGIYDLYKPLVKPNASDEHYLKAARWASIIATTIGLILVIWFNSQKGSLMSIHYKGIMIIIPSIVTTIFMGAFWRRFNATAACFAMVFGALFTVSTVYGETIMASYAAADTSWGLLFVRVLVFVGVAVGSTLTFKRFIGVNKPVAFFTIVLTLIYTYCEFTTNDPIRYIAMFVVGPENGIYIYIRALFGMVGAALIGFIVTYMTPPPEKEKVVGLTIDTLDESMAAYKGGKPNHEVGEKVKELKVDINNHISVDHIELSASNMEKLKAKDGDMVYLADSRWWLGGLRSQHVKAKKNAELKDDQVVMSDATFKEAYLLSGKMVTLEKIF